MSFQNIKLPNNYGFESDRERLEFFLTFGLYAELVRLVTFQKGEWHRYSHVTLLRRKQITALPPKQTNYSLNSISVYIFLARFPLWIPSEKNESNLRWLVGHLMRSDFFPLVEPPGKCDVTIPWFIEGPWPQLYLPRVTFFYHASIPNEAPERAIKLSNIPWFMLKFCFTSSQPCAPFCICVLAFVFFSRSCVCMCVNPPPPHIC